MEREFPGVSDEQDQGQAGDSEDQGLTRLNIDLDTTFEGRALKAILQSQVDTVKNELAEVKRQREQETEQALVLKAQAEAVLADAQTNDPERYRELVAAAAIAEKEAKLASLQSRVDRMENEEAERMARQEAMNSDRQWWRDAVQQQGMNPDDPEIAVALQQTLDTGDKMYMFNAMARKQQPQQQQTETLQPKSSPVLPPSGGGPRQPLNTEQKERLHAELHELYKQPTANAAKIAQIKAKLGQ